MPSAREKSPVSEKQRRLMHGIASGSIKGGHGKPSKTIAQEFSGADKGGKLPMKKSKHK